MLEKFGFFLATVFFAIAIWLLAGRTAAAAASRLKIITAPQTVPAGATSTVITVEAEDDSGAPAAVLTATHVSLSSTSGDGVFTSANATTNVCSDVLKTNSLSVTIATNTSRKSFCYLDSAAGTYTLAVSSADGPGFLGDSQQIIITATSTGQNSTTTPPSGGAEQDSSTSTNASIRPDFIKINEILPNPSGDDDGNEAVEIINLGSASASLGNWFLDDASDSGIKTSAYLIPTSTPDIAAGGLLVITIPKGHFALNNSGGDTANLYFPDKSLADSVSYIGAAPEDWGWQKVSNVWLWAPQTLGLANAAPPPSPSVSSGTADQTAGIFASYPSTIQVSEFMPNPSGSDGGSEWVELYNSADTAADLTRWLLDSGSTSTKASLKAYSLPTGTKISAKGYLSVTIPAGKFILNNSGGDSVRLFQPDGNLLQTVAYSGAPEGQSYAVDQTGEWQFTVPSPGAENVFNVPFAAAVINELLPNPAGNDDEFLELYNSSSTDIDLAGFKLLIGSHQKVFEHVILASSSFLTLYQDDLPANLRNSGQTVSLLDQWGRVTSVVAYGKAASGQAYARTVGGDYLWTDKPTPGQENEMVLAAETVQPAKTSAVKTKNTPVGVSSSVNNEAKLLKEQVAGLTQNVADLQNQILAIKDSQDQNNIQTPVSAPVSSNNNSMAALALVLSGLALLGVMIKFFRDF